MKKKVVKKLVLNKESILRLDLSKLHEIAGGVSAVSFRCTLTELCTETCVGNC